jgi:uncharacterized surface anchored protein
LSYSEEGYISVPSKVKTPSSTADGGVILRDVNDKGRILTQALRLLGANGEDLGTIGDVTTADYVLTVNVTPDGRGFKNFTVKFQNGYAKTSHQFQMEYYVGYNQFSETTPNPNSSIDYRNTIMANFTNNGTPYSSSSTTDFKTSTQEVNQGMKSGSYDPVTKEITWTVIANYNDLNLSAFGLNDPITGNQVYKPDSLNVTRGTIDSNGNFQAASGNTYGGNQVGKDYLEVTNPTPTGEDAQGTLSMAIGSNNKPIPGRHPNGFSNSI